MNHPSIVTLSEHERICRQYEQKLKLKDGTIRFLRDCIDRASATLDKANDPTEPSEPWTMTIVNNGRYNDNDNCRR